MVSQLRSFVEVELACEVLINFMSSCQPFGVMSSDKRGTGSNRSCNGPLHSCCARVAAQTTPVQIISWSIHITTVAICSFLLLTHMLLKLEYSGITKSIPWLLMPWLLLSPGHQQLWYRLQGKQVFVFHGEGFQQPAPSQCWEMIENANSFLCFLKWIHHDKS